MGPDRPHMSLRNRWVAGGGFGDWKLVAEELGAKELAKWDDDMVRAAERGDHLEVERLIRLGAFINSRLPPTGKFNNGRAEISTSDKASRDDLVLCIVTVNDGINPFYSWRSDFARTGLQAASASGHKKVVEQLLESGADVNAPAARFLGRTALQAAAEGGHEEIMELLIKSGANVNAPPAEGSGRTALQAAAENGHERVVKLLMSLKANVNAPQAEGSGRTVLQAAVEGGHKEIVQILVEAGADVNASPAEDGGRMAIRAAVNGGHKEIVKLLIDAKANVNAEPVGGSGGTALQAAAEGGHKEIVELLIEAGAKVNSPPAKGGGRTALQAAVDGGHKEIVKVLIDAEANVNAKPADDNGRTALQSAAKGGYEGIVKLLVDAGADVNASPPAGSNGRTALQAAAEGGHEGIVKLLIDAGANLNLTESAANLIVNLARSNVNKNIINLFIEASSMDLETPNRFGLTPLHEALKENMSELLFHILELDRVGIDVKDHSGATPLETAMKINSLPIIERLLSKGADTGCLKMDALLSLLNSTKDLPIPLPLSRIGLQGGLAGETYIMGHKEYLSEKWPLKVEYNIAGVTQRLKLDPWISISIGPSDGTTYASFAGPLGNCTFSSLSNAEKKRYEVDLPIRNVIEFKWWLGKLSEATEFYPHIPQGASIQNRGAGGAPDEFLKVGLAAYICFSVFLPNIITEADRIGMLQTTLRSFELKKQRNEISWIMCHPSETKCKAKYSKHHPGGLFLRSTLYRGNLRLKCLSIPPHGLSFVTLFLDDVHRRWIELLESATQHLSEIRDIQLKKGGEDPEITKCLLNDSQQWNKLRSSLQLHISKAWELWKRFKEHEALFMETVESEGDVDQIKNSKIENLGAMIKLSEVIENIKSCEKRIDALKEETKEMIELEFNLVSIYESRKSIEMSKDSNSLSLSVKRLSWITFIFLPLNFVSGLFGMNLNILAADPSWTWYFAVAVPVLALVMIVWIVFKYVPISRWVEKNIGLRLKSLLRGRVGSNSTGSVESVDPPGLSPMDDIELGGLPGARRRGRRLRGPYDIEQGVVTAALPIR